MPEIHAQRRNRLAAAVQQTGADAALITRLVNVRYLTGVASSNAAVLIRPDGETILATDSRYVTAAEAIAPDVEIVMDRAVATSLARRAVANGPVKLGVEEHDVTLALAAAIAEAAAQAELVHLGRPVEQLRVVKDDDELALIAEACAISCRALEELYAAGGFIGRTEQQIARDLENRMFVHGADGLAFDTIVASGPNSAIPHHRPTDRIVQRGEFLKIDFGALYRGYHADCTRTSVVGTQPADWQREIYELVAAAQRAGRQALAPGVACITVDEASRKVITAAGHGEHFGHGTGHGLGLEIHEAPTLGYAAEGRLLDRTPVTVEPGVYLPGRGGVRIEDTLVVRDGAEPELLTTTTKDLLVLDA
ncbi:MAG TPA: Xaa-Pro peptidase family protein [Jiangellales bacterium]|nr:Xaa-Pro peptidase family protein [Jiangellales bacterium]